ncbi:MAG: signal peptidase II [Firmicutes bacterium]|nr:signal peptidase II [Bacillota bacterium]
MKIILLMALVIGADQISKYAVRMALAEGESLEIIRGFFAVTHFQNDGAAFSSFRGQRQLLIILSAAVVIGALIFLWKNRKDSPLFSVSMALLASGGIGNLIDRVFMGTVTDMLSFSIFPPIFNIADAAVVIGCFLLLFYEFRDEIKRRREEKSEAGDE